MSSSCGCQQLSGVQIMMRTQSLTLATRRCVLGEGAPVQSVYMLCKWRVPLIRVIKASAWAEWIRVQSGIHQLAPNWPDRAFAHYYSLNVHRCALLPMAQVRTRTNNGIENPFSTEEHQKGLLSLLSLSKVQENVQLLLSEDSQWGRERVAVMIRASVPPLRQNQAAVSLYLNSFLLQTV